MLTLHNDWNKFESTYETMKIRRNILLPKNVSLNICNRITNKMVFILHLPNRRWCVNTSLIESQIGCSSCTYRITDRVITLRYQGYARRLPYLIIQLKVKGTSLNVWHSYIYLFINKFMLINLNNEHQICINVLYIIHIHILKNS